MLVIILFVVSLPGPESVPGDVHVLADPVGELPPAEDVHMSVAVLYMKCIYSMYCT